MESRANPNGRLFMEPDLAIEEVKTDSKSEAKTNTRGGWEDKLVEDDAPLKKTNKALDAVRGFGKKVGETGGKLVEPVKEYSNRQEKNLEHFYNYQIFHPRFFQVIVFILGVAGIITCLILTLQFFKSQKPIEPIYTKIEGIKRLGEMHLVKQQYESVIPISKQKIKNGELKKETLQFLLIAPIEVTGYIDFSKLTLQLDKDSLIRIQLPEAKVSKAYLDFSRTEEFLAEGKYKIFGNYLETIDHKQAYFDIAGGINEAKERIRTNAVKKHDILKETQVKAETFLRNFVSTLGYRVEFSLKSDPIASPADSPSTGDESKSEISRIKDSIQQLLQ